MYINLSNDFKKKSNAAIFSIIIFILVYLLLFFSSLLLIAGCIYAGIWLIAIKPMFITIVSGAGLAATGIFIFIFIIKFLFKKHVNDLSHLTEIKRKDAPQLFKLIDEVVEEAQTESPKKVYLTYDVNAFVFYNSSFWSMFLPIRKNLTIGMGLINITTKQELKAILAHEFGHFSQRSMKVGSYVYNVNKIIFNLVNDDEQYKLMIEKWANISGYFSIFATIALVITSLIQKLLAKMYSFVNLKHMALSREMEFHADEVAANIAGSLHLEESLLRLELGENAYNSVINYYEEKFSENKFSPNIYREQFVAMNFIAQKNNLRYKYNLPVVELTKSMIFNTTKLVITNQWASHPSLEERVEKLRKLNIEKNNIVEPARELFNNPTEMEEYLTSKIFNNVKYSEKPTPVELSTFSTDLENQYENNSFHSMFNNYYDNKNIDFSLHQDTLDIPSNCEELFNEENTEKVYSLNALTNDIETLKAISNKELKLKTFDYDGKKYNANEAKGLLIQLEKELENTKEEIKVNDIKIYNYFLKLSEQEGKKLDYTNHLQNLKYLDNLYDKEIEFYRELTEATEFISHRLSYEIIKSNLNKFKPLEDQLKLKIKEYLDDKNTHSLLSKDVIKDLDYFAKNTHIYFNQTSYIDSNISMLNLAISTIPMINSKRYFKRKKQLLDFMQELESNKN